MKKLYLQKLAQIKQLRNGDQGISATNPGDKEKVDTDSTDSKLKELDKRFIDSCGVRTAFFQP